VPKTGEVTFYLSLPSSAAALSEAATKVGTPGSSDYRRFSSLDAAARQFGATDAQIDTVAESIKTLGLQFAADPTRLFGRVTGSTQQWQAALGTALSQPSAFFDVTQGNNDLAGVGCCNATTGYDLASGLGVPNWATLPATLPKPG